jgi:hypothetical protein
MKQAVMKLASIQLNEFVPDRQYYQYQREDQLIIHSRYLPA